MNRVLLLAVACIFFLAETRSQETYILDTKNSKPIAPTMWGLFFEDINRGADGGLYAELVKNRSFDFPDPFMGWTAIPARYAFDKNDIFLVINQSSINDNDPKYLQVTVKPKQTTALMNEGFNGVTVEKNASYQFTLVYRPQTIGVHIRAEIQNAAGKAVGSTIIPVDPSAKDWTTTTATITTTDTTIKGKFALIFEGEGKIDIDRVSLFPSTTWQNRPGGLRADLVQKLANIHPGFLRFPGGCIVEGQTIANRYQWKKTIGPLEDRKLILNTWNNGVPTRQTPDYFQSFGLGFMEYFQLCEDLKTEPMPILNCGISCQFDAAEVVPAEQIDPYVQDALDLIEFANGDANSKWGARRVALGHFEPFHLKMIGIGNENWGPQYVERLELFTTAIKAKYPQIQIITSTGYSPNAQFKYMDSILRKLHVDIIDEHYYQTPSWFMQNAKKYDNYDRKGPKIFLGEYAAQSVRIGSQDNKNTLLCALGEAAFMTGLERNSDIVTMAAYAPLFAHVDAWQWTPNLIWFDNKTSYATPSYYVQQLFAQNKGTKSIGLLGNNEPVTGQDSVWASAAIDETTNDIIIKLVNPSDDIKNKSIALSSLKNKNTRASLTQLSGNNLNGVNSIQQATAIAPATSEVQVKNKKLALALPPYSFTVVRFKQ